MEIGDTITVVGVSSKGKNRVRELGDQWTVVKFDGDRVDIRPVSEPVGVVWTKSRWIKVNKDPDFRIAE